MKYEDVIEEVDRLAPNLTGTAYKVLWRLIALSIKHRNPALRASHKYLAQELKLAKESVAQAIRDLQGIITVRKDGSAVTTFIVPERWVPEQPPLFISNQPLKSGGGISTNVSTDAPTPPRGGAKIQVHKRPGTRTVTLVTRPDSGLDYRVTTDNQADSHPGFQDKIDQDIEMGTRVPIESNRIEVCAETAEYLVIVKAFHTVEIRPDQREDAQILTEVIEMHRIKFDSAAAAASRRDPKVIARLLAIAPIEDLCDTILQLRAEERRPGTTDMWYFTVCLDRLRGINHKVTASVIEQTKSKAHSVEQRTPLFEDQLLAYIDRNARRMA